MKTKACQILTTHLFKIFEKCIRGQFTKLMEDLHLHSDSQCDFRKGRSCLSKQLAHHDWILHSLAEGKNIDVLFLDFAKAFDKVDHGIQLHKIKARSILGKLDVWIHDFQTVRWQVVTRGIGS